MKVLKWIGIVVIGLILLGLLLPDTDKKPKKNSNVTETIKDDIEVVKSSETVSQNMSTIHVELKNNTDKLLTTGQIKTIYEDKKGTIVGTGLGAILNLPSGATRVIDCLAMDIVGASNYKIEVTPLLYE